MQAESLQAYTAVAVILTRIWAITLAVLAVAGLAGLVALSTPASGFPPAAKVTVTTQAEAALVALEAQIRTSPVRELLEFTDDATFRRRVSDTRASPSSLTAAMMELAQQLPEKSQADLTFAVLEPDGTTRAIHGVAEERISALIDASEYPSLKAYRPDSVVIGNTMFVAGIAPLPVGRLLAIAPIDTSVDSMFRRSMGANTPAALFYHGAPIGDPFGDQPIAPLLAAIEAEQLRNAPERGPGAVKTTGEAQALRLIAIGRVPGFAGHGPDGARLVVLSRESLGNMGPSSLFQALLHAQFKAVPIIKWILLGGFLVLAIGLAMYLPEIEALGPMRRLAQELDAVAEGSQLDVYFDRYASGPAEIAQAAARAIDGAAVGNAHRVDTDVEADVVIAKPTTSRPSVDATHENNVSSYDSAGAGPAPLHIAPSTSLEVMVGTPSPIDYHQLYQEFMQTRTACGETSEAPSFERFTRRLRDNEAELRAKKSGVKDVHFSVYVKEGRAALKARVIRN